MLPLKLPVVADSVYLPNSGRGLPSLSPPSVPMYLRVLCNDEYVASFPSTHIVSAPLFLRNASACHSLSATFSLHTRSRSPVSVHALKHPVIGSMHSWRLPFVLPLGPSVM